MIILIDNGHGVNTPGKCSPDGSLLEYDYARTIAQRLIEKLRDNDIQTELITPERYDLSIPLRVRRVNEYCKKYGTSNCALISIHCNAAGSNGQWMSARGWSAHVSLNASRKSKVLASYLAQSAEKLGLKVRRQKANQDYWPQNLGICRDTNCAAVLTENLFQDNISDVRYLLSEEGKNTIVNLHFNAIVEYIKYIEDAK